MRIAFLGLGLIGGSVARALRAGPGGAPAPFLSAWTPGGTGPRLALEHGLIDAAPARAEGALDGADLVVLAAPPLDCLELLGDLAGPVGAGLQPDAVITDVASTKRAITRRATELGLRFVGGHPMAGVEASGFGAADPGLFRGRPWIVVPTQDVEAVERVEALARACGALPTRMDATEHDAAVAAISHLPLVLAAALIEAVAGRAGSPAAGWSSAAPLVAGGWASMTRLARGDVEMGTGIAVTNAAPLAARLRDMRLVLDDWIESLEAANGPDEAAVRDRLSSARAVLEDADDG
jgi:prephenate dehydrogenase